MAHEIDLDLIAREDGRYPPEAYDFLRRGIGRAVQQRHGTGPTDEPQHVTGQDVCWALRDLAIKEWGLLASTVLARWGVDGTADFGNMLYVLIDKGVCKKSPEDQIEDFDDVYDFKQAFGGSADFELAE